MKFFIEVLEKKTQEYPDGKTEIYYELSKQTEYKTKTKADTAFDGLTITPNQKKRIHKCYHDEQKIKSCEII